MYSPLRSHWTQCLGPPRARRRRQHLHLRVDLQRDPTSRACRSLQVGSGHQAERSGKTRGGAHTAIIFDLDDLPEEEEGVLYNGPTGAAVAANNVSSGGSPGGGGGPSLKRFTGEDPEYLKSWKS